MRLLEPLAIRGRELPTRVVFGSHETNLGRDRTFSDRHAAYYARRAEGGCGLIVTEDASVHPLDWPYERSPLAGPSDPGWEGVVEACSPYATFVLAGLNHSGGQGTSHWSQRELWAPSRVPEVNTREVPKWMDEADIRAVIDGFATSATTAVRAGCDGVDVNIGQFSLIRQFASGLTNHRDDAWGADRTLFAREVLTAVRRAIGEDPVLAIRLCADELAPWAGITPETGAAIAAELAPLVDLITVVRGSIFSIGATRPDGHTPPTFNRDLCAEVRAAVRATGADTAVVAQGSIVDVGSAEALLADGAADAVEMTRAQLADARLVAKLTEGVAHGIRPCVLCNQTCSVRDNRNPLVTCIADPRTGHETEDPDTAAPNPLARHHARRVLVVGGGPAGLEAARVSAIRGHHVTLVEQTDTPGGELTTTSRLPGRDRFDLLRAWLIAQCERHGVEIVAGHPIDISDPAITSADIVVLAMGGRPGSPTYAATTASHLCDPAAAVADPAGCLPPGDVLVWDPIGGPIGVGTAEVLAAAGRSVHLATPDQIVGNELARSGDMGPANARLHQAGVTLHRRNVLRKVRKGAAELEDRFSGRRTTLAVAGVVDAGHRLPDDALYRALGGPSPKLIRVGDCVAPRTVHEAILEGRRAALAII